MDLRTLKYERNVLQLVLRRWDDLLPAKDRETHPMRNRIAEEIKRYDELIAQEESRMAESPARPQQAA